MLENRGVGNKNVRIKYPGLLEKQDCTEDSWFVFKYVLCFSQPEIFFEDIAFTFVLD